MQKEQKKSKHIFFWIITALSTLVYFAVLELSKNTVLGWVLSAAALAALIVCETKWLREKKKAVHLGLWAALMGAFVIISLVSAPPFRRTPAVDVKNPEMTETLQVEQGQLSGVYNADKSVEVYFPEDDETETFRIVTTIRGNSLKNLISIDSPLGRALLHHKAGDTVHVKVNENAGYDVVVKRIGADEGEAGDTIRAF